MPSSPRLLGLAPWIISTLIAAPIAMTGCDGPCQDLAEKICSCEPNTPRERSCLVTVDTAVRDPLDSDSARCEELLKTCSCAALDRGDFAACGLTLDGDDS